jgi:hypothetical protein
MKKENHGDIKGTEEHGEKIKVEDFKIFDTFIEKLF